MLSQEFFNSFITIYRPYLKLAEPILERQQQTSWPMVNLMRYR